MVEKNKNITRGKSGHWVTIRLLPDEKQILVEQADAAGLSLSEYARRRIFGSKPIVSRSTLAVVAELRKLGGLLKGHFNLLREQGASEELFASMESALRDLSWAVQRL